MTREDFYKKYGRSLLERILFLLRSLDGEDREKAMRWADIYAKTISKSLELYSDPVNSSKVNEASKRNYEALRELEEIFYKKFGVHLVETKYMLNLTDDDPWPTSAE